MSASYTAGNFRTISRSRPGRPAATGPAMRILKGYKHMTLNVPAMNHLGEPRYIEVMYSDADDAVFLCAASEKSTTTHTVSKRRFSCAPLANLLLERGVIGGTIRLSAQGPGLVGTLKDIEP